MTTQTSPDGTIAYIGSTYRVTICGHCDRRETVFDGTFARRTLKQHLSEMHGITRATIVREND